MLIELIKKEFSFSPFKQTVGQNWKKMLAEMVLMITVSTGLATLTYIGMGTPFFSLLKTLQLFGFLGLGYWHASNLERRLPQLTGENFDGRLLYSVLLFFIILILLSLFYFLTDSALLFMATAGSCAFLIPSMINAAWDNYTRVPEKRYPVWYIPQTPTDKRATISLNSIKLHLKISRKYFDIEGEIFTLTVPGRLKLSTLFHQFMEKENRDGSIECNDEYNKQYGWEFYTEDLNGLRKRYLNPDATLIENALQSNTVIIARRVRKDRA